MNKIVLLLFLLEGTSGSSQSFQWVYGSNLYDYGNSLVQTYDTGFAIAGATSSWGNGNEDAYLIKTDSLGVFQWSHTYGTTETDKALKIIQVTSDSGYAMVGYSLSPTNGYDVMLIKTDKLGNEIWRKTYGGLDWDFGYSLKETLDGGFILCGETYSYGNGNSDAWLIKTNANGDTLWTHTYGDLLNETANDVIQTSDTSYVFTGRINSMENGLNDLYMVKTDLLGDTIWTGVYGSVGNEEGNELLESGAGGYVAGGSVDTTMAQSNSDIYIVKVNPLNGSLIWQSFQGGSIDEYGNTIVENPYNYDLFIGGLTYQIVPDGQMVLIKTNQLGNWLDTRTFGYVQYQVMNDIIICNDTLPAFVGTTKSYGYGQSSVIFIKIDLTLFPLPVVNTYEDVTEIPYYDNTPFIVTYPNPVIDIWNIEIHDTHFNKDADIQVFDLVGHFVKHQKISNGITAMDISELRSGTYLYRIVIEGESYASGKIIKR